MAIPVNPFTFTDDLAAFLANAYGNATYDDVLTDEKTGSGTSNTSALTVTRATTQWANLVDSYILASYPYIAGLQTAADGGVAPHSVIYEPDFSSLATNTLSDGGAETIDGLAVVVANSAEMSSFRIFNGSGLQATVATSNGTATTMTSVTQAATYVYWRLDAIPGYNPAYDHIFEIYCPTITQEQSGDGVMIGLWDVAASPNTTSAARMRAGAIVNNAGTRIIRATTTSTVTNGTENRAGHNVLQIRVNASGQGHVASGTWASGWPVCSVGLHIGAATTNPVDPLTHGACRLFIAFPSVDDATPTTQHIVQRMRVRRAG